MNDKTNKVEIIVIKEIYQISYSSDNPDFDFTPDKPIYVVIGFGNFEEDLAIPVSREYIKNKSLRDFLKDFFVNKNEDEILESLNIQTIDIDPTLRKKLKNTLNSIKSILDGNKKYDIYSMPLDLGTGWQIKGQAINEKIVDPEKPLIDNLMYIDINAPSENYVNVRQYMSIFKFKTKDDVKSDIRRSDEIIIRSGGITRRYDEKRFGPVETPVEYTPDMVELMKLDLVKRRIEERKKWIPYSDKELFYLIFAPIRFLRFKHMQNRLIKQYNEGGKIKPSIVGDIRDDSLLGGVWEYKDLEFLAQIDMLVKNGIIVPTDFNFYGPPYSIIYKAVKDGILYIGGIEHSFDAPKEEIEIRDGIEEMIKKPGHFMTYMCMKKMGSEGTQVLLKYQNELGTTSKMMTCEELDMEMAGMSSMSGESKSGNPSEKPKKMDSM